VAAARVANRAARLLVVGVLLLVFAPRSYALDPEYLKDWPSPDQVLADHQGKDRQDTLAHQMAALHHLDRSIEDMAGTRRWHGLTADENRLRGEYYAAAERIRDEVNSTLSNELPSGFNGPFAKPPLRKWYALQWKYERDPKVRDQTLGRYLSPPLLAELGAKKSASDARAGEAGRELLDGLRQPERGAGRSHLVPLAVLVALGLLVAVIRGRRRNAAAREAERTQDPAPDVRPDIEAAVKEVMDSLGSYLVAAAVAVPGREGIPISDFASPFFRGFMLRYCIAALVAVSGTPEGSDEGGLVVYDQFLGSRRLAKLIDWELPDAGEGGVIDEDIELTNQGSFVAAMILKVFKDGGLGLKGLEAFDPPHEMAAAESGAPEDEVHPRATRLHPAGPHAARGHRMLMVYVTEGLMKSMPESN
jgi:hypothetical protein